jgi:hypothetical protein
MKNINKYKIQVTDNHLKLINSMCHDLYMSRQYGVKHTRLASDIRNILKYLASNDDGWFEVIFPETPPLS